MSLLLSGSDGVSDVDGTAATPAIRGTDANTGISFGTDTVTISTGGVARVTTDASGNVGIGVTPSAWSASFKALQISSQSALWSSGAGVFLSANNYNDGSNKYIGTGNATRYYQLNGEHVWEIAPSGTAGNAISFTQAMTLDSSGNLLVGAGAAITRVSAGNGQFSTSSGLYIFSGSLSDNSFLSRSSSGSGTTTWYIGNQAVTTSSDMRLKDNVKPTERNALDLLKQWEIVDHTWNDPSDQCENNRNSRGIWTGVIAQQVQQVTPWLVNKPTEDFNNDGSINPWTMDFGYAVPLLVKAIQEQQALITQLQADVAELKGATP
jgi:hypothetical protein